MIPRRHVAALVVGAGPAGAVAAGELARRGVPTLLVGSAVPAAGDHDVLVGQHALRKVASGSGDTPWPERPIETLLVSFDKNRRLAYEDPGLVLCGQGELVVGLRHAAIAHGAEYVAATVSAVRRRGDTHEADIDAGGDALTVTADHIVIAAGVPGTRRLTGAAPVHGLGLSCAQRCAGVVLGVEAVLHLQAPPSTDPHSPPRCIRVMPDAAGGPTVTVTATTLRVDPGLDATRLMLAALHTLRTLDERFAALGPVGPIVTAPTSSGFAPELAVCDDRMLVGDAAGLVNPFTGEGIGFAIHSGLLAGETVATDLADPTAARRGYVRRLSASFVGYFETARHAARRYHLAWRVLADTTASDGPFFAKGRRAILLPEGISGLGTPEGIALNRQDNMVVGPFLLACNEIAVSTVRKEWPFIATLVATGQPTGDQAIRPALLFAAAQMVGGGPPRNEHAVVATATELAMLGALALIGPGSTARIPGRGVDWHLAAAVLAGDFLLSQAARLIARCNPDLTSAFADWLAELTALRADAVGRRGNGAGLFAAMFEFPARVGAQLGGASGAEVEAMREFGRHCGTVFLHAEDLLALRGHRTRLDTTLDGLLSTRLSVIPALLGRDDISAAQFAADTETRSAAVAAARDACRAARTDADGALSGIPAGIAKHILGEFVRLLAAPADEDPGN